MFNLAMLKKICLMLIFCFATIEFANAQQTININNENSLKTFLNQENRSSTKIFAKETESFRVFEYNKQLKELTSENKGDILQLDFFNDRKFSATIMSVTTDYDGVIGIVAKISETEHGYCFISISDKGIAISADLPQNDEQFFVAEMDGKSYLSRCKMSKLREEELPGIEAPKINRNHSDLMNEEDSSVAPKMDGDIPAVITDDINEPVVIDVLIVYTEKARIWAANNATSIDNVINQAFSRANLVAANSLTNITFNLVHKYKTDYVEVDSNDDLYNLQGRTDVHMDEVHCLRQQYGADLVMLIPEVGFTGGLGFLLDTEAGFPTWAFALSRVQQTASTYTMVHEMGHNMGCSHHWQQIPTPSQGLFPYSYGYRGQNASSQWYSTIMTYEAGSYFADGNYAPRIPYFSDPNMTQGGVNIGDATYANNALTLKKTKHVTSRYSDYFNPHLVSLNVNIGTLTPSFNKDITEYTVNVPSGTPSINVTASRNSSNTTLTGTGIHSLSSCTTTITVTAEYCGTIKTYTITVNSGASSSPTVSPADTAVCPGSSITLTASGESGGIFNWYDSFSGGTLLYTGANYNITPAITTTYYVSQTISGCESGRIARKITVDAIAAPIANDKTVCFTGSSHSASATPVTPLSSIKWYNAPSGGSEVLTLSGTAVGVYTAYAAAVLGDCESSTRTLVTLEIVGLPAAPIAGDKTVCHDGNTHTGGATIVTLGSTIKWYNAPSGGSEISVPSRSTVGTSTAYAAAVLGDCESSTRTLVTLEIVGLPAAPTANDKTVCFTGSSHSASATPVTPLSSIKWYNAPSGGSEISAPSRSTVGTSTAYAAAFLGTCESSTRTLVTLEILALPATPTASVTDTIVCIGTTGTITLTGGTTYNWYTVSNGGSVEFTSGASYSIPTSLTAGTHTYYVSAVNTNTCESTNRTMVIVRVNSTAVPVISPSDTAICPGSSITLTASGTGGVFNWYDSFSGGTLLYTGANYNITPATTTTYYVSQTISGGCESGRIARKVTVDALAANITKSVSGSYCDGGAGYSYRGSFYTEGVHNNIVIPSQTSGCDTLVILTVVKNQAYNIHLYDTICTGWTYLYEGNSYTAAGDYVVNLISMDGCDSIMNLHLHVLQSCNVQNINLLKTSYELTYGAQPFSFTATSSSGLPVTFSTSGTSVEVRDTLPGNYYVTVKGVGTTIVTLRQAGDNYYAPTEETVTIKVNPAQLTITAKNQTATVNGPYPILKCSYSGFVYGEDSTVLTRLPIISCTATTTSVAGTYPITVSGAEAVNYLIKYVQGQLTIRKVRGELPNAFTPHKQNSLNDIFGAGYDLVIYNRWGICMYKGKDGWDGRYKGSLVAPGVYYYVSKDSDGIEYRGSVNVIKPF